MLKQNEQNQIKSEFSNNLNLTYEWFNNHFTQTVKDTFQEFWGTEADVKLLSISENTNSLVKGEEFFVTKIRLNKELSVFIRLSAKMVKILLENILGKNGKTFNIEKITELEAKILTGFDDFLYQNFAEHIKKAEELPKNNTNYNECNLTFYLRANNMTLGKIVIKIPTVAIVPQKVTLGEETFTITNFLSNTARVNLNVGHTRIKLNDLKSLEQGDIVLLEYSNSSQMTLKYENYSTQIKVVPNPSIMIENDFDNGDNPKGDNMSDNDIYNMWDSIQVDIGAEFEKVKLTLGELKQISEGLVVDIGSVYDNKIDLKVEDKIVASGELVIINDRYGVRINQVFTEEPENQYEEDIQPQQEENYSVENLEDEQYPVEQEQEYAQEEINQDEEENFDYSDFDVDEDDL